jgi:hypothetical protein
METMSAAADDPTVSIDIMKEFTNASITASRLWKF